MTTYVCIKEFHISRHVIRKVVMIKELTNKSMYYYMLHTSQFKNFLWIWLLPLFHMYVSVCIVFQTYVVLGLHSSRALSLGIPFTLILFMQIHNWSTHHIFFLNIFFCCLSVFPKAFPKAFFWKNNQKCWHFFTLLISIK